MMEITLLWAPLLVFASGVVKMELLDETTIKYIHAQGGFVVIHTWLFGCPAWGGGGGGGQSLTALNNLCGMLVFQDEILLFGMFKSYDISTHVNIKKNEVFTTFSPFVCVPKYVGLNPGFSFTPC